MSQKAKAEGTTTTPATSGTKPGDITSTGELIRVTATNTNTDPLLKTGEDYKRYQADVRTVVEMQVEDIMAFQKDNGYVPMRGDTSIKKHGLEPEEQEAVLRGEKRLEVIDKEKGIFRAEAIKPVKK